VAAEVATREAVAGIGRARELQEPLRVLDDPATVDPHVVRHHVAREAYAALPRAIAEDLERLLAAEIARDAVVVERVGRGDGLRIARVLLDHARRRRPFPQADEPQAGQPPARQPIQFLHRDVRQGPDLVPVPARELVHPHVRALGDQDRITHPVGVPAEGHRFGAQPVGAGELHDRRRPVLRAARQRHFLEQVPDQVQSREHRLRQDAGPVLADVGELTGEVVGAGQDRRAQQVEQGLPGQAGGRLGVEELLEPDHEGNVAGLALQLLVVEELAKRPGRRIAHHQIEEDRFARDPGGDRQFRLAGGEPARQVQLREQDRLRREEAGEGGREPIHAVLAEPLADPREAVEQDARALVQRVVQHDVAERIVQDPQAEELLRVDRHGREARARDPGVVGFGQAADRVAEVLFGEGRLVGQERADGESVPALLRRLEPEGEVAVQQVLEIPGGHGGLRPRLGPRVGSLGPGIRVPYRRESARSGPQASRRAGREAGSRRIPPGLGFFSGRR